MYKLGQFIVNRLPLSFAYRFATFFSDLHYFMSFRDRRSVKNNLKVIFPEKDNAAISAMARKVFRNFGKYLVDFFRMANQIDKEFIAKRVKVHHLEYLQGALRRGKGVILLTAHIGNWELGGVFVSLLGYPFTAIALPHKERPVNELFNKQRESKGLTVVPINQAIRRCLEVLKNNGVIALVADRVFTGNGKVMDFLGKKTLIPKGAAVFACRTGAPIVPTFCFREEGDTYSLNFLEPINPPVIVDGQVEEGMLLNVIQQYTRVLEEQIRQHPTQWLMFRPFWLPLSSAASISSSEEDLPI